MPGPEGRGKHFKIRSSDQYLSLISASKSIGDFIKHLEKKIKEIKLDRKMQVKIRN